LRRRLITISGLGERQVFAQAGKKPSADLAGSGFDVQAFPGDQDRGDLVTNIDVNDRTAFYDDDGFNYQSYWSNRNYEHRAEVIAIRRLLNGRRFGHAADIGGGYGRLSVVLEEFADKITLVDASSQQLSLAADFLVDHPGVEKRLMDAASLDFPDASVDLVAMVRVLHHLPDPAAELAEVHRILRPGGAAVVEVANVAHALNRVRHMVRRERLPVTAVDIRSAAIREQGGIPFVNHHPATVAKQFRTAGLQIERVLSVSNLRHPLIKKALPGRAILAAERMAQARLAKIQFGPSLFFLLRK
jgi:ubiquinone/menaquinone biosynthesis C-methylase UbiE